MVRGRCRASDPGWTAPSICTNLVIRSDTGRKKDSSPLFVPHILEQSPEITELDRLARTVASGLEQLRMGVVGLGRRLLTWHRCSQSPPPKRSDRRRSCGIVPVRNHKLPADTAALAR